MRIVSLVPAATEVLADLGALDHLVGISHECDYPSAIRHLPRLTASNLDSTKSSASIDAQVRAAQANGETTVMVSVDEIQALRPDLIVTQALCEVCAVSDGVVRRLSETIRPAPEIVTLNGRTIAGVIHDIVRLGERVGTLEVRMEADRLTHRMEERLNSIRDRAKAQRKGAPPVRALCIEWLDPVFLAGHWVPELIEIAGGLDVGTEPGLHSRQVELDELDTYKFDLVFIMPCGFDVARSRIELDNQPRLASWLRRQRVPVILLDAGAYTSRPGPRLVEGAAIMAAALGGERHDGFQEWS